MVVPYLRNPRRLRNQPIAIKTKSQYHLEPDHTNTYDTSLYRHVGRRTEGGGGGGYLFSSGNSTNGGDTEPNPVGLWVFRVIVVGMGLVFGCCLLYFAWELCKWCFYLTNQEDEQEPQQTEDFPQRDQARQNHNLEAVDAAIGRSTPSAPHITAINASFFPLSSLHATVPEDVDSETLQQFMERKQLIRSKLHYQVVLSDKSNIKNKIFRGEDSKEEDATEASDDDDNNSVIASNRGEKLNEKSNALSSSCSSVFMSVRNLLSSWRLGPSNKDVCSICLERFHPGTTICIARNSSCNHIFHENCIESWLMDNDDCPLCRSNVMQ